MRTRRPLLWALCLSVLLTAGARVHGAELAPGDYSLGLQRYRVSMNQSVDDADALIAQLLATCRCRIEPYAEIGFNGIMIRASEAAARMLSGYPGVVAVEHVPAESEVDQPREAVRSGTSALPIPLTTSVPVAEAYAAGWDSGTYVYDGAGNIKAIGSRLYGYDPLGRLTYAGTAAVGDRQKYTYDPFGNLLTIKTSKTSPQRMVSSSITLGVSSLNNRVTAFTEDEDVTNIDAAGHATHVVTQNAMSGSYDAQGRALAYPDTTFAYDATDMVTESIHDNVRVVYLYTANDERLATIEVTSANLELGSDWTIRDLSGKVLRRFKKKTSDAPWMWDEDYIYRDGQLLASEIWSQERTLHYHLDHLGTPCLITGNGGAQVSTRDLYPFGEEDVVSDNERMKFTGHERDYDSLDYMHARYYGVKWGRFLSVDPGRDWALRRPQSWNRYSYVRNNPANATDPSGRAIRTADLPFSASMNSFLSSTFPWANPETMSDVADHFEKNPIVLDPENRPLETVMTVATIATLLTPAPGDELIVSSGSVVITAKRLAVVEKHLARFGHIPENAAMVERLRGALAAGGRVVGADKNFLLHELAEARLMNMGVRYDAAHRLVLWAQGVSPYALYHPEVIRALPSQFNNIWRAFWGI